MKIGDRIYVRGYVDEIRKDTVIIRNAGGYFGTIPSEVITGELPSAQPETNCSEIPNNSDLISRKTAIDALHMHLMYRMGTESNKQRLDAWINNLPSAQPEQRWISCRERLPEKSKEVLVCYDFKGHRSVLIGALYDDGKFYGYDDEYLTPEGRKYRKAIAWMPLPEPYKEKDNARA